jgi:hypothetical protein
MNALTDAQVITALDWWNGRPDEKNGGMSYCHCPVCRGTMQATITDNALVLNCQKSRCSRESIVAAIPASAIANGSTKPNGAAKPNAVILPPEIVVSVDDIQKEAESLKPGSDPRDVLRKMACATLEPVVSAQLIETIRVHTKLPKDSVKEQYKEERKKLGLHSKMVSSSSQSWLSKAVLSENGPLPIMGNVALALREDPAWVGVLALNQFTGWITLKQPPPWVTKAATFCERSWSDADTRQATIWTQMTAGIPASPSAVFEAVAAVAEENPFHPVKDYLDGLVWDGVPRLDNWLIRHLGAVGEEPEDKADREYWCRLYNYTQAVGARFLISAVARIKDPDARQIAP